VLVADHDEHIRHTVNRMKWAYRGAPSAAHRRLVHGDWQYREREYGGIHQIAFSEDGTFINSLTPESQPTQSLLVVGDWTLNNTPLTMTATYANFEDDGSVLWKDINYEVLVLDSSRLCYREDDDTVCDFRKRENDGA
jgi:hypothetical protein